MIDNIKNRTLEVQQQEFASRKLLATPMAGLIAWVAVAISGMFCSERTTVYVLFYAIGGIVYLALILSKFTGEDFLNRKKPKNIFDRLFFYTVAQAILVYSIALPFFSDNYTSLPLSIGILTGLMWLPLTWIINHWVGIFHTLLRTTSVLSLYYIFPNDRFVAIPIAIVLIYVITIVILLNRNKTKNASSLNFNK